MAPNVISETYPGEQKQVAKRVHEIMAAVRARDIDLLESYHLWGPKFTKFDDWEPLSRQDAETTKQIEREGIGGAASFTADASQLKADVFGDVAIATCVMD